MANNLAEQLESPEFNDELSRQLDNVIALPLSQENRLPNDQDRHFPNRHRALLQEDH